MLHKKIVWRKEASIFVENVLFELSKKIIQDFFQKPQSDPVLFGDAIQSDGQKKLFTSPNKLNAVYYVAILNDYEEKKHFQDPIFPTKLRYCT